MSLGFIEIVKGLGANNVLCETFCAKRFVRNVLCESFVRNVLCESFVRKFWAKRFGRNVLGSFFFGTTFCIWGWVLGRALVETFPGRPGTPKQVVREGSTLRLRLERMGYLNIASICSRKHEWGLNTMPHPNFFGF